MNNDKNTKMFTKYKNKSEKIFLITQFIIQLIILYYIHFDLYSISN